MRSDKQLVRTLRYNIAKLCEKIKSIDSTIDLSFVEPAYTLDDRMLIYPIRIKLYGIYMTLK